MVFQILGGFCHILFLDIGNIVLVDNERYGHAQHFVLHHLFLHFRDDWCRYRFVTLLIDLAVQFVNPCLVVHLCVAEATVAVLVLEMIGET